MSKFSVVFLLFASLALLVIVHGRAEAEEQQRHRAKRYDNMADDMGDYPMSDEDMMQRIFRTPLKRQWCRFGMVYNPALGTCTLSLMQLLLGSLTAVMFLYHPNQHTMSGQDRSNIGYMSESPAGLFPIPERSRPDIMCLLGC